MKSLTLIGTVVLVAGVVLYFISAPHVADCQSGLGQFGRALSPEFKEECRNWNLFRIVGIVGGIVGGILVVSSFVQPRR